MPQDLLKNLNESQQKAVLEDGPLLILAGAGSGKTRTLTYRAAHRIQEGTPEDRILLTTFTNKAAGEMQERLIKLVGTRLPFAGTFHSLCARLLRIHGHTIGIENDYIIYDTNDQKKLIKTIIKDLGFDPKDIKPYGALSQIDSAKNELIDDKQYAQMARGPFQEKIARIYRRYQQNLEKANALDFSDLLFHGVTMFKTVDHLREKYQTQFQHVLVDEYQDTNKAQYELTKLFTGSHQNLCVVGDASQAIYSWRGADYRNLNLLEKDFPTLTTIKLERNYRSTQNILDAAHGVIQNNSSHPILSLWTDTQAGDTINLYEAQDEYAETRYLINQLRRNNINYGDTAVLYRTNAQSRVIEEEFMRAGIPYVLVGGVKFYERKEIKDVISYLRYTLNQADIVSFERIMKLGKRRFQKFETWRQNQAKPEMPPLEMLDQILDVTGYLERYDDNDSQDQMRIENVKELRSVAQSFETLPEFLENIALVEQDTKSSGFITPKSQISDHKKDAVVLMTLHSSKGLEFDQVFIVGMEEGLFPHSRSLMESSQLEEERRLCYVGITRAKNQLHLTYAKSRLYFGSRNYNQVSRFIKELPSHVVNTSLASDKPKSKPIDDDLLEAFLKDEVDIDALLNA